MSAVISDCGRYRYRLDRVLDPENPNTMCFIMCNPSTADAEKDDATIRSCKRLALANGCGRITVVNLWAYRARDPKALKAVILAGGFDATGGVQARMHCLTAFQDASLVVAAWGRVGAMTPGFEIEKAKMRSLLARKGRSVYCFGVTKDGVPRHPLLLGTDTPLVRLP